MATKLASRRDFLAGLTSLVATPSLGWAAVGDPVALSAVQTPQGLFNLVGLARNGALAFRVPLPARGHAAAAHPTIAEAVAIARRPGTFAKVIDCVNGHLLKALTCPEGRHFYGHGAFSADGHLLFTPENDITTGAGRIGVWDRSLNYARIDEFSSGGIGPHEILRMPTGNLAVANGGIRTHPASGREKLNLETMRGNLSVFSPEGRLLDQAEVPNDNRMNSLRHISSAPDGRIICGFQWQGDPYDTPQLVSFYDGNGHLKPAKVDEGLLRTLDGYIGSVCAIGNDLFAASSPRGGRVFTLNADGEVQAQHRSLDVCGLSALEDTCALTTDGYGTVYQLSQGNLTRIDKHNLAFDNHLVSLI
ncbi:MAG: DUF1513 domain-containing protein [Roseobacter sp.]